MIRLGLTGSIGMGKTATAGMFAQLGVPVYDADAAVHRAYAPEGPAVGPVLEAFPEARGGDGGVDRGLLRKAVLGDPVRMARLEGIIHPIIAGMQTAFLLEAEREGHDIVVLDIPLLFETGGQARVDYVAVVTAPPEVQRERVLARGLPEEDFRAILARQVPDAVKREQADFVIDTSLGFEHAAREVAGVLARLRSATPPARRRI